MGHVSSRTDTSRDSIAEVQKFMITKIAILTAVLGVVGIWVDVAWYSFGVGLIITNIRLIDKLVR